MSPSRLIKTRLLVGCPDILINRIQKCKMLRPNCSSKHKKITMSLDFLKTFIDYLLENKSSSKCSYLPTKPFRTKGQYSSRIFLNGTYLRDLSAPQTNSFLKSPKLRLWRSNTSLFLCIHLSLVCKTYKQRALCFLI